jgi:hypothetical protein
MRALKAAQLPRPVTFAETADAAILAFARRP